MCARAPTKPRSHGGEPSGWLWASCQLGVSSADLSSSPRQECWCSVPTPAGAQCRSAVQLGLPSNRELWGSVWGGVCSHRLHAHQARGQPCENTTCKTGVMGVGRDTVTPNCTTVELPEKCHIQQQMEKEEYYLRQVSKQGGSGENAPCQA